MVYCAEDVVSFRHLSTEMTIYIFLGEHMLVTRIRIRNLKSIEKLDVDIEAGTTLLYGPNGIGKSSTLEALSLLGHLHHLPMLTLANGEFVAASTEVETLDFIPKLRSSGSNWQTIEGWFEAPKRGGVIAFALRHETIDGSKPFLLYIYLGIKPDAAETSNDPSLTSLLSSAFKDEELRQYLCIVTDPNAEDKVKKLVELVRLSTTRPRGGDAILVSYVNTDLNDFGRGNDLRESPKDLAMDFAAEIKQRLQIPFTGPNGSLDRLEKLNNILKSVLRYPSLYVPGIAFEDTSFEISRCAIDPDTEKLTFTVTRLADNRDYSSVDFLSAGENECVFVFMLIVHLPLKGGLLLLDEPDLHLGPHQKREFFKALYQQIEAVGCQCVIATHSEYALVGFENVSYAVLRPVVETDGKDFVFRYVADAGVDLRLAHSKLLLLRAAQSLGFTGIFSKRILISLFRNRVNLLAQVNFFVTIVVILVLLSILGVSAFSDTLRVIFDQTITAHDNIADKVVWLLVGSSATLVGFLGWSIWASSSERRKQRRLFKKALLAKARRRKHSSGGS